MQKKIEKKHYEQIINNNLTREYMVSLLRSEYFLSIASSKTTGSRMPRANLGYLEKMETIIPENKLIIEFTKIYKEIYKNESLNNKFYSMLNRIEKKLLNYFF